MTERRQTTALTALPLARTALALAGVLAAVATAIAVAVTGVACATSPAADPPAAPAATTPAAPAAAQPVATVRGDAEPVAVEPPVASALLPEPAAVPAPPPAAAPTPRAIAPTTVKVPGDQDVEVVFGPIDEDAVIVYLHGVCGDPLAFESWTGAVADRATFISLRGDAKCDRRRGRREWTYNHDLNKRRIDRAIDAVDQARWDLVDSVQPAKLRHQGVVLVGYSQGASRVVWLGYRFPEAFPRLGVIAIAKEPQAGYLIKQERVLLMGGELDVRHHIKDARDALLKQGTPVKYLELPDARHGEYGPEAERVMDEGIGWLFGEEPAPQ